MKKIVRLIALIVCLAMAMSLCVFADDTVLTGAGEEISREENTAEDDSEENAEAAADPKDVSEADPEDVSETDPMLDTETAETSEAGEEASEIQEKEEPPAEENPSAEGSPDEDSRSEEASEESEKPALDKETEALSEIVPEEEAGDAVENETAENKDETDLSSEEESRVSEEEAGNSSDIKTDTSVDASAAAETSDSFSSTDKNTKDKNTKKAEQTTEAKKALAPVLTVTASGSTSAFKVSNIPDITAVASVKFAVWSKNNGQDDLAWYNGTLNKSSASASLSDNLSKHKDTGTYYVHAYAYTGNGTAVFLAGITFQRQTTALSGSALQITAKSNNKTGQFRVTLKGVDGTKAVSKVKVAVWNRSDKSDKVWYKAASLGSGKYSFLSNIGKHGYHLGTYTAKAKIYYKDGTTKLCPAVTFALQASSREIVVGSANAKETKYPVTIKKLKVPAGAKNVKMAVWSETGGQDDLVWYTMKGKNGGSYKGKINIKNHCTAGIYNIHVYYTTLGGEEFFIEAATLRVEPTASLKVKAAGRDDSDSCFSVSFSIKKSSSSCKLTKVAVWCGDSNDDIVWYPLKADSSGKYTVGINTANHYGKRGNYNFRVYAKFANGIEKVVKAFAKKFEPASYLIAAKSSGTSKRVIKYVNAGVSSVVFRVWSEKGGKKDSRDYTAKVDKNGAFYATVKMSHFTYDGKYYIQVLSGSSVLDTGSFIMIDYLEQAVKFAKDDTIGYSQIHRNLNPDLDCSSLVYYALKKTGYAVPGYAFATYTMLSDLQKAGFKASGYTNVTDLQTGDILLRDGHTEIYAGNGLTVGAHEDEDKDIVGRQTGDQNGLEVCVAAIKENWQYVFRYRTYTA